MVAICVIHASEDTNYHKKTLIFQRLETNDGEHPSLRQKEERAIRPFVVSEVDSTR